LKGEHASPKRVLIAEDEPSIVISLEFLLAGAGYEVAIARDGAEAIDRAIALPPDLAVLDVMLPAIDGFEVCRRLRRHPDLRNTRILMLTARGRESEARKGTAAGADAYLTKPFSTKELMAIIARLLEQN
jgi:two-component system, OmpR family, alkaline phosphatase synthesis response regulator PhoP